MRVLCTVTSCSGSKAAHPLQQANLIETLYREAVKPISFKLFFVVLLSCGGFEAASPFLKIIMLLILVCFEICQCAPQEKWAVGMNNLISYACPSGVTALLEKLVRKLSIFKILLIYCMPGFYILSSH